MSERDEYARIGAVLRAGREGLGYTQVQLAAEIGVAESTYSRYEAGKQKITIPELKRVAALLDLPLEVVLGGPAAGPPLVPDLAHRVADLVAERLPAIVRAVLTESNVHDHTEQPNKRALARQAASSADYRYLGDGSSHEMGHLVRAAAPLP